MSLGYSLPEMRSRRCVRRQPSQSRDAARAAIYDRSSNWHNFIMSTRAATFASNIESSPRCQKAAGTSTPPTK